MKYLLITATLICLVGCPRKNHPSIANREILFFGDSITAGAMRVSTIPGRVDWGASGFTSANASRIIAHVLRDNPSPQIVTIAFGTNDAYQKYTIANFTEYLRETIVAVQGAGRIPMLPTIPYSTDPNLATVPNYNAAVTTIRATMKCAIGPDLYSWFLAHPEQLGPDGIHPTQDGYDSVNRLWEEALASVPE
jgi:lysophospholipase L1-like esterase